MGGLRMCVMCMAAGLRCVRSAYAGEGVSMLLVHMFVGKCVRGGKCSCAWMRVRVGVSRFVGGAGGGIWRGVGVELQLQKRRRTGGRRKHGNKRRPVVGLQRAGRLGGMWAVADRRAWAEGVCVGVEVTSVFPPHIHTPKHTRPPHTFTLP